MYEIYLKIKPFMVEFAQKEIFDLNFNRAEIFDENYLKVKINSIYDLHDLFENLFYYSRCIENIYLKLCNYNSSLEISKIKINLNFIKQDLSFKIICDLKNNVGSKRKFSELILNSNSNLFEDEENPNLIFKFLNISNSNFIFLDLIGFSLDIRDYKLNSNSNEINSSICNYLFYLMGIDLEKNKFSIIDPIANLGSVIIEASLFNPKVPLNIKKKDLVSFSKIFTQLNIPILVKNKNKYLGIVQDNTNFKFIKENISYSSQKVKVSKYDLDYLDVKFTRHQIDYMVINTPVFKDDDLKEEFISQLLYMVEFMVKKKIGLISRWELDFEIISKVNLKIKVKKEIIFENQKYFIYVLVH